VSDAEPGEDVPDGMGDAVNRVGEEPEPAIDPWIAENQAEPIRIADRGPGGGTPPGTPAPGE
jgi:hypothetical protein